MQAPIRPPAPLALLVMVGFAAIVGLVFLVERTTRHTSPSSAQQSSYQRARNQLFGNQPLDSLRGADSAPLRRAVQLAGAGDQEGARRELLALTAMDTSLAADRVQAWTSLRELGVAPYESMRGTVIAVLAEYYQDGRVGILAAYGDGDARWISEAGATRAERGLQSAVRIVSDLQGTHVALPGIPSTQKPGVFPITPRRDRWTIYALTPFGMYALADTDQRLSDPKHALHRTYESLRELLWQVGGEAIRK